MYPCRSSTVLYVTDVLMSSSQITPQGGYFKHAWVISKSTVSHHIKIKCEACFTGFGRCCGGSKVIRARPGSN